MLLQFWTQWVELSLEVLKKKKMDYLWKVLLKEGSKFPAKGGQTSQLLKRLFLLFKEAHESFSVRG